MLGICLGLQLLLKESAEAPGQPGLGLLPGRVKLFDTTLPVPHVGWAAVTITPRGRAHGVVSRAVTGIVPNTLPLTRSSLPLRSSALICMSGELSGE